MFGKLIKEMVGFTLGVVFGSVIATITTHYAYLLMHGSPQVTELLQINECLIERHQELNGEGNVRN